MAIISTSRLILRAWERDDFEPFAALNGDPVVMRHFPSVMTADESRALMAAHQLHIDQHQFGAFAVVRRDTGEFIGACGCKYITWPHSLPTQVEIGWRFAVSSWGHGFATEAARGALHHCFETSGLNMISSFTVQANRPSWSVMERLKMIRRPDLDFDHPRVPDGNPLKRHIVYLADRASD
jgi:RimJ/RimL family protein N-acetyltransferase